MDNYQHDSIVYLNSDATIIYDYNIFTEHIITNKISESYGKILKIVDNYGINNYGKLIRFTPNDCDNKIYGENLDISYTAVDIISERNELYIIDSESNLRDIHGLIVVSNASPKKIYGFYGKSHEKKIVIYDNHSNKIYIVVRYVDGNNNYVYKTVKIINGVDKIFVGQNKLIIINIAGSNYSINNYIQEMNHLRVFSLFFTFFLLIGNLLMYILTPNGS